jgi:pteridine reductase
VHRVVDTNSADSNAGRVALVTGGARRVGRAIVEALHASGFTVVIHANRSLAEAGVLRDALVATRAGSADAVRCDLLRTGELAPLVEHVVARHGRLDVLVNNASTFHRSPIGATTEAHWDDLVGSNLKAPFFLSQAAAPELRKRRGCIVNLIDIHARKPMREYALYCAAKAGLSMLTLALARDLGPEVRVNGVAPGAVLWPETPMDEAVKQEIVGTTTLKRVGEPADVARTVRFLVCDAPYLSGQIIAVDGGRSIGW